MSTVVSQAPAATGPQPPAAPPRLGGLFRAELRRRWRRRLVVLFGVGYLGLLLAGLAVVFATSSKDDAGARAEAQVRYEQVLADCQRYQQERPPPGSPEGPPAGFEEPPCEEQIGTVENFYYDPRFRVVEQLPELIVGSSVTWAMVAFLVGASALGADWSSRTLPALLTWEPRRVRVLLTKLAAVLLAVGLVAVLVQAITFAGGWLTGSLRGTFERVAPYPEAPPAPPNVWELMLHQSGRGILLALITVTMGFAAAGFFRATAGAVGLGFAYFVLGEFGLRALRPRWEPWLFTSNVGGLLERGGLHLQLLLPGFSYENGNLSEESFYQVHLNNLEAGLYLAGVAVAMLVLALLLFRRREIV